MDSTSASPQRSCSCPPTMHRRVAEMQCGSVRVASGGVVFSVLWSEGDRCVDRAESMLVPFFT